MKEIWKTIDYYIDYQISNLGRVKSFKNNKEIILKHRCNGDGYVVVTLSMHGIPKEFSVHRLVCVAFVLNTENKKEVNHKDGIKTNNILSNLEWSTRSENMQHAFDIGLKKVPSGKDNHNYGKKLSLETRKKISEAITGVNSPKHKGFYKTPTGEYPSSRAAALVENTNHQTILYRVKSKNFPRYYLIPKE